MFVAELASTSENENTWVLLVSILISKSERKNMLMLISHTLLTVISIYQKSNTNSTRKTQTVAKIKLRPYNVAHANLGT